MPRVKRVKALTVAGTAVSSGRKRYFEIPVGRLATGNELGLPVCVIHGAHPGPRVWLSGAIHGDEINGVDIIRRVIEQLDPGELRGSVIAVPIVNVFGFINQSRYLPDRRDLNRSFPGSPRGSLAGRIAHLFMKHVVSNCSYGLDLHTGSNNRTNLPQIRADLSDDETRRCALAFDAPVVIDSQLRDGSLREAAKRKGVHVLLYEAGEAHHFNRIPIQVGVRGVLGVLAALDMIDEPQDHGPRSEPFEARGSRWIRAGRGGILHLDVRLGDEVQEDQRIGFITDTFGRKALNVRSSVDGIVIGHTTTPLVNRGDGVVHVAFDGSDVEDE